MRPISDEDLRGIANDMEPKAGDLLKLSDKELLKLAVGDARKLEATGRYRYDGESWHTQSTDGVCIVCLAGAVVAKRGAVSPAARVVPSILHNEGLSDTAGLMYRLDGLRLDAGEVFGHPDDAITLDMIEAYAEGLEDG